MDTVRRGAILFLMALVVGSQGCASVGVKHTPPMRRHITPMLDGAVAVLQPKIYSEDGEVYLQDTWLVFQSPRRLRDYRKALAESVASAIEFSGLGASAKAVATPAENLLAWSKSEEAKGFRYVLVTELIHWRSSGGGGLETLLNPLSLFGFLGIPVWPNHFETSCELNIQVMALGQGETVMMFAPERSHSSQESVSVFTVTSTIEEHLLEFQRRLAAKIQEELEARSLLYSADRTVVPYNWQIHARQMQGR